MTRPKPFATNALRSLSLLALGALGSAGCATADSFMGLPTDDAAVEAAAPQDSAAARDAALRTDAPANTDALTTRDAATQTDAAVAPDVVSAPDVVAMPDVAVSPDVVVLDAIAPDVVTRDVIAADVVAPRDVLAPDVATPGDASSGCAPVLTINELQTAGTSSAGDEYVELFNAAGCTASLTGYTLGYTSATGTSPATHWTGAAGDVIPAGGYFVIAGVGFTGAHQGTLSGGSSGALSGSAGGVGLYASGGARADSIGYGTTATTPLVERAAAPAPAAGGTVGRIPDGHDTNDNSADFRATATPTPGAANR